MTYDEINLMNFVRSNAFAIRGLPVPEIPVPAPPTLLPIANAAAISWQGSVGAQCYQVERGLNKRRGPAQADWQMIASNVDEALTQYRPQFADENVPAGTWFYRVRAQNDSGISEPSNIVGPVEVKNDTLVDELADFSRVHSKIGDWKIANRDCRSTKEDAHRAAGTAGNVLVYRLPNAIEEFSRVYVFSRKTNMT